MTTSHSSYHRPKRKTTITVGPVFWITYSLVAPWSGWSKTEMCRHHISLVSTYYYYYYFHYYYDSWDGTIQPLLGGTPRRAAGIQEVSKTGMKWSLAPLYSGHSRNFGPRLYRANFQAVNAFRQHAPLSVLCLSVSRVAKIISVKFSEWLVDALEYVTLDHIVMLHFQIKSLREMRQHATGLDALKTTMNRTWLRHTLSLGVSKHISPLVTPFDRQTTRRNHRREQT